VPFFQSTTDTGLGGELPYQPRKFRAKYLQHSAEKARQGVRISFLASPGLKPNSHAPPSKSLDLNKRGPLTTARATNDAAYELNF
jgi:hypothetical protein